MDDLYILKLKHYIDSIQYTYSPRCYNSLGKHKNKKASHITNSAESFRCSASRSISKIKDYCLCNNFDFFFTLTLKSKKRNNILFATSKINKAIKAYAKKAQKFEYLYVFEEQKNGRNSSAWVF